MIKITRNLALFTVFSIIVAGCTTLLNTQADFWADQAEQIARNCPAAGEYARQARQAADDAAGATASVAQANLETEAAREQLQRELEQAESALDNISLEKSAIGLALRIVDGSPSERQYNINVRQRMAEWLQRRANCLATGGSSDSCELETYFESNNYRASCNTATACEREAEYSRMAARMVQDNDRSALEAMLADARDREVEARKRKDDAQLALDDFNKSTSPRTQDQNAATEYAAAAENAYHEAQRIAAEQCGEGAALQDAPPKPSLPSGDYPQDILNSQGMGLPGGPAPLACPASCAGITQAWCSINCSVFIGPQCSLCPICAAQGGP